MHKYIRSIKPNDLASGGSPPYPSSSQLSHYPALNQAVTAFFGLEGRGREGESCFPVLTSRTETQSREWVTESILLPCSPPRTQLISGAGRCPGMGSPPFLGAKIKGAWILLAPVPVTCKKCLERLFLPQLGQKALGTPHLQAYLHCGNHISPFSQKTHR